MRLAVGQLSRNWVAVGLIISSLLVAGWLVVTAYLPANQAGSESPPAACGHENIDCYNRYYAKLAYSQSGPIVFANLRSAYQQSDFVKSQCHQLTHVIGRTAVKKHGSLAAAYRYGDSFCWSGYYHGATEQAISDIGPGGIKQQLNVLCAELASDHQYSFSHYNCAHGLGHGLMVIDGYNLFAALKTCDALTDTWEQASCHGGVFMENVMVAVREGGHSNYLKTDDLLYPCTAVAADYKQQCYLMQTSYILQQNGYDFAGAFALCAQADSGYHETCYQSVGRDASGSTNSQVAPTKAKCDLAPGEQAKLGCMIGAAKDFVSYYHSDAQAYQLCQAFGGSIQAKCEETVRSYHATL